MEKTRRRTALDQVRQKRNARAGQVFAPAESSAKHGYHEPVATRGANRRDRCRLSESEITQRRFTRAGIRHGRAANAIETASHGKRRDRRPRTRFYRCYFGINRRFAETIQGRRGTGGAGSRIAKRKTSLALPAKVLA